MVGEAVFVNSYNFNPIGVDYASIYIKNSGGQVKKGNLQGI
jgi:hypothetical protein